MSSAVNSVDRLGYIMKAMKQTDVSLKHNLYITGINPATCTHFGLLNFIIFQCVRKLKNKIILDMQLIVTEGWDHSLVDIHNMTNKSKV
jgi:hypothetical protein